MRETLSCIIAEVSFKFVRFFHLIDYLQRQASTSERALLITLRVFLISILKNKLDKAYKLVANSDIDNDEYKLTFNNAIEASLILQITYSTSPSVSVLPVEPETYHFVEVLFNNILERYSLKPAIWFSMHYNFEEYDFGAILSEELKFRRIPFPKEAIPSKLILLMPRIEYRNPLMWVNLAHEIGHAIEMKEKLSKALCPEGDWLRMSQTEYWLGEFTADIIALEVLGPAYFNGFINYVLTQERGSLRRDTIKHPSAIRRVRLMDRLLKKKKTVTGDTWHNESSLFYLRVFEERIKTEPKIEAEPECPKCGQKITLFTRQKPLLSDSRMSDLIEEKISSYGLPSFETMLPERIRCLADSLKEGRLISAHHQMDHKEIQKKIQEIPKTSKKTTELLHLLQERENSFVEIINAGWLCRYFYVKNEFPKRLKEKGCIEDRIFKLQEEILFYDILIQKSLEAAFIHKFYREIEEAYEEKIKT